VVTPSLNPTTPVYLSAAAGWRSTPSVGLTYYDRIGSRTYDGENVYEFSSTGYSADLNFGIGERLAFSGHFLGDKTTVEKDEYYEGKINLESSESQLNLTLSHEGFAIFGLGMRSHINKEYIDDTYQNETTTEATTIPSMSIKLGSFYFGGGVEIVKESSTYMVNNHWINTVVGLAFMSEKNEGLMFRVEVSAVNSPEANATAKQDLEASDHSQTNTTRFGLDMQYKGLVFEAFTVNKRESTEVYDETTDSSISEIQTIKTQLGFLIAPEKGIVLGFHFIADQVSHIYTDKLDSFQISLAYNFGL